MRLDHVAFRVRDRKSAAKFLEVNLFYRTQQEFPIDFGDGEFAECISMVPTRIPNPEIFLSDGTPDSIVGEWVEDRVQMGARIDVQVAGGIHHLAFSVHSVEATMKEWQERGIKFSSDTPIYCPEDKLIQVFTQPIAALGGMVIELIERGEFGFCKSSVKKLMESSVIEEKGELT